MTIADLILHCCVSYRGRRRVGQTQTHCCRRCKRDDLEMNVRHPMHVALGSCSQVPCLCQFRTVAIDPLSVGSTKYNHNWNILFKWVGGRFWLIPFVCTRVIAPDWRWSSRTILDVEACGRISCNMPDLPVVCSNTRGLRW